MQIQYLTSKELSAYEDHSLATEGVIIAMPFTNVDHAQRAAKLMASRANAPGMILCIQDEKEAGFIAVVNRAFAKTQSAYFAYVAQDALAGRDWLKEALTAMGDSKNLLGFNDGKWAGALAGFGLARRSWATQHMTVISFTLAIKGITPTPSSHSWRCKPMPMHTSPIAS